MAYISSTICYGTLFYSFSSVSKSYIIVSGKSLQGFWDLHSINCHIYWKNTIMIKLMCFHVGNECVVQPTSRQSCQAFFLRWDKVCWKQLPQYSGKLHPSTVGQRHCLKFSVKKYCLIKAEIHSVRGFLDTGWESKVQSTKGSHVDT